MDNLASTKLAESDSVLINKATNEAGEVLWFWQGLRALVRRMKNSQKNPTT